MSVETIYNYLRLSERIGTSGQPQPEQFTAIREAGFALVVNLLPDTQTLAGEEEQVRSLGMDYIRIPVWWNAPEIGDIEQFFAVMEANKARHVFVHCAANMRVSVFMYLYCILCEGISEAEAARNLHRIWTPNPIWEGFIKRVIAHNVVDNSYGVALLVEFANSAAHDVYQDHPDHLKFIEECSALWSRVQVYDSLVDTD